MNFKAKDLIFIVLAILAVAVFFVFIAGKDSSGMENTTDIASAEKSSYTVEHNYVGNINNHKLHSIKCGSLPYEQNRVYFSTVEEANRAGYTDKHKECMGE